MRMESAILYNELRLNFVQNEDVYSLSTLILGITKILVAHKR